jgi:NADP-dependent 3-hydroxy acid dehydrogenase YdfG
MAFDGNVVLVTGAASGMGRLAAQRMADAGKRVAALDMNEVGLRSLGAEHPRIRTCLLDTTDQHAVTMAVKEIEQELGPIDRVYNAAGIMPTSLLLEQDVATIHRVMSVNYGGLVNVAMATLAGMVERGRGDLIHFASIAGWIPSAHFGAYNASKFAVVAFTEVLAAENRRSGVRFACVCPPPVATPLLDQARSQPRVLRTMRPLRPEDVLDRIERCLERGKLMVFPDARTAASVWVRRLSPRLVWAYDLFMEGL